MAAIDLILDGDGKWPELQDPNKLRVWNNRDLIKIATLSNATARGNPSVAIRIELMDGTCVVGETTLKLFLTVADAMKARHGDPR